MSGAAVWTPEASIQPTAISCAIAHTPSLAVEEIGRPLAKKTYRQESWANRPGRTEPIANIDARSEPFKNRAATTRPSPPTRPSARDEPVAAMAAGRKASSSASLYRMPSGAVVVERLKPTNSEYKVNATANAPNAEALTERATRKDRTALVTLDTTWSATDQTAREREPERGATLPSSRSATMGTPADSSGYLESGCGSPTFLSTFPRNGHALPIRHRGAAAHVSPPGPRSCRRQQVQFDRVPRIVERDEDQL